MRIAGVPSTITGVGATFRTTTRKPDAGRVRIRPRPRRHAVLIVVGGALIGTAIPLGWFLIGIGAGWDDTERYAALIGGVAVSYFLLATALALLMARLRVRQTRRETNLPWHRSVTEWRDIPGEFDHVMEEMLVTGAAISLVLCFALLFVAVLAGVGG
jgi:hypothetical protein